jgi:hypothetical protein
VSHALGNAATKSLTHARSSCSMSDYEANSLVRQLKFTWGSIKKMDEPFALTIASLSDR